MKFRGIAQRIIFSIVPVITISTLLFIFIIHEIVDSQINEQINNNMQENLAAAKVKIQRELSKNTIVAKTLVIYAEISSRESIERGEMTNFLMRLTPANRNTIGCGILYEPYALYADKYYAGAYVHMNGGEISYNGNYGNSVDYFSQDWYIKGRASREKAAWSSLYYDPVPGTMLVSASLPFFDATGKVQGVAVADMSLADIQQIVRSISVGKTGDAFVLGPNGEYIAFLDGQRTTDQTIQTDDDKNLVELGRKILDAEEGIAATSRNGVARRAFFSTIPETRWSLVLLIDEEEINYSTRNTVLLMGIVPFLGLIATVAIIILSARRLGSIAKRVNNFADLLASGNFAGRIAITEYDEFGTMEKHLNKMAAEMESMHRNMQKMVHTAQGASRAKSDFLSNMSHEIRTPMNAIIGMTAIAKKTGDAEKKDICLKKIEDASTHLLGVINDILDMSKIEANKLELAPEEFDFEKTLQRVAGVIGFRVDEKKQNFTVHISRDIPRFLIGDDQRLAQVITNLLTNAVKFTPEKGTVRLNVRLIKKEGSCCTLQFDVSDTGIGISEEQQGRLFTSFAQADSSVSRKFGGTGLGLAISKRIVEMMNGRIWINSTPGKGSVFSFTIEAEAGTAEGLAHPGGWKSLRVLAVDDDPEIRAYFREIAEGLEFSCDTAASGEDALEMIRDRGPYSIYFIDWKMPVMDGIELSRHITGQAKEHKPVVIVISAADWTLIEDDARQAGVDKFISKPLFPSAIADCLSECLGVGPQRAEGQGTDETALGDFSGRRILLVEDVEINREVVLALLEPAGLEFDCAENGAEAVRLYQADPDRYDLIFMDIHMPGMDGFEATHRIRELEKERLAEKVQEYPRGVPGHSASIPIIAMTANVFREDIEKCFQAGMDGHVGKPLAVEELAATLRKYLG
jgi:signal transduction histidine kinase/CheY-like chemotaxis protein